MSFNETRETKNMCFILMCFVCKNTCVLHFSYKKNTVFDSLNETFLRDSVSSKVVAIKGYKFVRTNCTVWSSTGTDGGEVGKNIKSILRYRIVR
jgi:hypothetical protein